MPRGVPRRYSYQCPKCGHVLVLGVPANEVAHKCQWNKNRMTTYALVENPKTSAEIQAYYEQETADPLVKDGERA